MLEMNQMKYKCAIFSVTVMFGMIASATHAVAADEPITGVVVDQNRHVVAWTKGTYDYTPAPEIADGLTTIYTNLGTHYPKGVYTAPVASSIIGPNSPAGPEQWLAVAFKPTKNITIKEIFVAAGYSGLGTNEVTVNLYADKSGIPGKLLQSWHKTDLPPAGSCCDLVEADSKAGIPVKGGTQYWIALEETAKGNFITWNDNSTKTVASKDGIPQATSDGTKWVAHGLITPPPSFGVYGN